MASWPRPRIGVILNKTSTGNSLFSSITLQCGNSYERKELVGILGINYNYLLDSYHLHVALPMFFKALDQDYVSILTMIQQQTL